MSSFFWVGMGVIHRMNEFRGEQMWCFGAHDTRAATGYIESIHHLRLRYAHLGLIRFDLFEVVNEGAVIPLQRESQGPVDLKACQQWQRANVGQH